MNPIVRLCRCVCWLAAFLAVGLAQARADFPDLIERVKPSVVSVGTFSPTASPQFNFRGTGFVVGDGRLVATNAHVIPESLAAETERPVLAVLATTGANPQARAARLIARDTEHDLALLAFDGPTLPPLTLGNSDNVREGQSLAFTGFPIGGALGFHPVTHRGMVAAITPIALPSPTSQHLNEKLVRRLKSGSKIKVLQLDATAYPGNSGSPVYAIDTGEVIGIINMVFIKGTRESALSQPTGISYALPANLLNDLLRDAKR